MGGSWERNGVVEGGGVLRAVLRWVTAQVCCSFVEADSIAGDCFKKITSGWQAAAECSRSLLLLLK
jgi:hypothetical protein